MSINDDILSRELKHRALLSLYEKKLDNDLTKVMSSHKKRLVNSTLKNGMKGSNALNRALGIETRKTYRRIYRDALKELKQLAKVDAKFQASTLNKAFGKVYRARVYTGLKVNDLIINSAGTYSQQIASISLAQQRRIKSIVKQGMVDNLAVNEIADNIGRTVDLPQAQLRTLSRTAITETSTTVNKATYKLNEDVLDGYEYVATLDSRTSLICANLDGRVFRLDDPKGIRPPQHFNCRSTTVPIVKSHEDLMNTDSNRISKRRLKRMTQGKRASFNGQVPADTKFEDFFARQDNDFKLAVLGTQKRVDIYNTGKLKFSQFSTRDGKLVSISRLEELLNGTKASTVVNPVVVAKAKTTGPIYGVTTEKELEYLDDAFGTKETPYSKAFKVLPPVKTIRSTPGKGAFYSGAKNRTYGDDLLEMGRKSDTVAHLQTMKHEFTHRIDEMLMIYLNQNPDIKKKFFKGFEAPLAVARGSTDDTIISGYVIKDMIKDDKALSGLGKRLKAYEKDGLDAVKLAPDINDSKAFDAYYGELNKKFKSPVLTDDEIKKYLKYNNRSFGESQVYMFKLKLKNKVLDNSRGAHYDRQFSHTFNDYLGAITKESMGWGHGKPYYNRFKYLENSTGQKYLTRGNSLEAWAEHTTFNQHTLPEIGKIERKLAEHYAPNTTKAFDTIIKRMDEL